MHGLPLLCTIPKRASSKPIWIAAGQRILSHYQASIDDAPSLKEILAKGLPRVVDNLVTFEKGTHEHTCRIARHGYAASYTMPMFHAGEFIGFLFFNADESNVFTENVLDIYGHLISLMIINEIATFKAMNAALRTTSNITHLRDPETGSHLDRSRDIVA